MMFRHISRALSRRLDRVAAVVDGWQAVRDRAEVERLARIKFHGLLLGGLRDAGIDPATVPAMRRFDEPYLPDAPPVQRKPCAAPHPFFVKIAHLARRCRERPPPLAVATPMQLFAMYCFSDRMIAEVLGE